MRLSPMSDATRQETMTIEALATMPDADTYAIKSHLHGLENCNLAKTTPNGKVRATVTGEELLEIDAEEVIIVDTTTLNSET